MKTLRFTLMMIIGLSSFLAYGQTSINITDPSFTSSNPLDCSTNNDPGSINFFDSGGDGSDYGPNEQHTITVCPDIPNGTPKISASFGAGQGFSWDVHSSDTLYVYDGVDTNAPLLGAYNSNNAPTGFTEVASWANSSGCLTFVFESDGSDEGSGWEANISCASPSQDFEMHIEAFVNGSPGNDLDPADTGYVNVCQGDSILFVAKPIFPNSLENTGSGYSQTVENVDYLWEFSNGYVGPNNDSVWFAPNVESGVYVSLRITDIFPSNQSSSCKVRVSTTPDFSTTGTLQDTVCFNESTELTGGVSNSDTAGIDIPENSFQIGGNFAGETYLPDGSGNTYSTTISMSGFPAGTVVQNAGDLERMCVNMEHSFLGDLEMWLECPDGTEVTIFNSYGSGGYIPGGFQGGGVFLGEPVNLTGTGPGNGYEYCFSSVNNNWGDFANEYQTNTIPTPPTAPSSGNTMDPNGIYAPEDSYIGFAGCPLNGDWTLHVQDNWSIDDGYIFEWGIYFDPSLYPENEFYQNTVEDAFWSPSPSIVSNPNNDTLIVVAPDSIGDFNYTFNVVDDFGCPYDTTITLNVRDTLINTTVMEETIQCAIDSLPVWAEATGSVPPFEYEWEDGQNEDTAYYDLVENGVYEYPLTVTDNCGFSKMDTAIITLNQTLQIDSLDQQPADCGIDNGVLLAFGSGFTGNPKYKWQGPGSESNDSTNATVWGDKPSGWYYFSIKDNVCFVEDSILLEQNPPPTASFTANPSEGAAPLDVTFINESDPASLYEWDFGNGESNTVEDQSDQYSTYLEEGTYTVTLEITEGACSDNATEIVEVFFPMDYDMPNIFTPNGDGQNDLFTINAEYATEVEIVIVNRWGNVVFESTDVDFAWNGKVNNNGQECTDGTYFYRFKIKGSGDQMEEEHGFVQLMRGK